MTPGQTQASGHFAPDPKQQIGTGACLQRVCKKMCKSAHSHVPCLTGKQERFYAEIPGYDSEQTEVSRIKMSLFRTLTLQSSATFQIFSDFGCLSIFSVTLICRPLIVLSGFVWVWFNDENISIKLHAMVWSRKNVLCISRHKMAPAEIVAGGYRPHYSCKTRWCHWSLFLIAVILPEWVY